MGHLRIAAIHPFENGNGTTARTLTEMVLAQDENLPTWYYMKQFWLQLEPVTG